MSLTVIGHPLAQHLLGRLRDRQTQPEAFRALANRLSLLLALEATTDLSLVKEPIMTPMEPIEAPRLSARLAAVPILRAGLAMVEPVTQFFPDVTVGYIGLQRSEQTALAHRYYCKLPRLDDRVTLCLDPMLATGGSASQALSFIRANGAKDVRMVCVVAAPEGVARLQEDHPGVRIFTAALDRELDPNKFILPGLGDFGDRLFGTE
jgi:uracil phosphoribosyltransferase